MFCNFKMVRSQWPGKRYLSAATFSTLLCLVLFVIFGIKGEIWKKTGQEPSFFGANIFTSNPGMITKKYPMSIYPAPWLIGIIWPTVVFWNLAGIVYLFYRAFYTDERFGLTRVFYSLWTVNWSGTIFWTFYFDTEDHVACLIVVFLVMTTSYAMQYIVCKAYNTNKQLLKNEDKKYEGMKHPFRYLVVEGLGILCMWSSVAFSVSVGYFFAYKNSKFDDVAVPRGIFTADESATIGITYIIVTLTLWVVLDVVFFGKFSDCSRYIYPTLSATMFGLMLSNYDRNKGLSLNNYLCLFIGVAAATISVTRRIMKRNVQKIIPQTCTHSTMKSHDE